ncbi:penicillin acylase family protein, partial [Algoriphagus sp.]|uniref:penicillin acylase family protein n=1 Tax=Algoriphagus sp. TaxID=1872435 RepID=UPI0025CF0A27
MKRKYTSTLFSILFGVIFLGCDSKDKPHYLIDGLHEPVEIIRDEWGINHIYAKNQHDLFFAQGYAAAKDRLFQFEIWRRQSTGTVAEILGERELKRDIGTRLFKYRGNLTEEMNHYHSEGEEIINAYTQGVNAYIGEILSTPDQLPIEFKILNIVPEKWTSDVVISRHQGLLGNIEDELEIAQAVAKLGVEKVKDLNWFHPKDPDLSMDPKIDQDLLFDDILELYKAYRKAVRFNKSDILPEYRNSINENSIASVVDDKDAVFSIGSNNWVVSGELTENGNTYMANDPHRTIAIPSLRYMVHLVAPGWNVIGGGEPEIPGISIGHNEYGAWGLTVFETDGEDLYVYELNPENNHQYLYNGEWEDMEIITETFKVKDKEDVTVDLFYTRHGPVTLVDSINNKAYAVRCAWLEPGGSPYLASLRMDQAKTWEEFREACNYSHIPGENMIWADKNGNIGWQSVGIAPIRKNFSGMVPVPGDGRYEWDGYLPIIQKPNTVNPKEGFFASANQNIVPEDYEHWDAIGFT